MEQPVKLTPTQLKKFHALWKTVNEIHDEICLGKTAINNNPTPAIRQSNKRRLRSSIAAAFQKKYPNHNIK